MQKIRIRFEKTGNARYISHLDLMRTMMRALRRAGISVKYTEGFNPHPHLVFGNPLSLGHESVCELCDAEIKDDIEANEIKDRLNAVMPKGLWVRAVTEQIMRQSEIAMAKYRIDIETETSAEEIKQLFSRDTIELDKKGKAGVKKVNIVPLIHAFYAQDGGNGVIISTVLAAGSSENLNPEFIVKACQNEIPSMKDSFAKYTRLAFYNIDEKIFE
ncbi:MAG: TIGR03936 family radical SAM-associated protein [Bacillota bacterium]|nr:TIGR03936 family radical SAM-associated protein [Bacillota bacterium]